MSQQGITIVSTQVGVKGRKLSDVEFLSIKEFEGKVRSAEGERISVGDLVTLTANIGKDMYIAKAQVTFSLENVASLSLNDKVELKLDGVIIETAQASLSGAGGSLGGNTTVVYEFKNMGRKVLAGQTITLDVSVLDSNTEVEGFIECFEENTGESPQIPST